MLETILTRIILRYANKYICDTFRTDTFSLWGGDLVVQNFELQIDELSRILGTVGGLRLTRGFVRELRVHVPWNAIRSQSLRVEVKTQTCPVHLSFFITCEDSAQGSCFCVLEHASTRPGSNQEEVCDTLDPDGMS